MVVRLARGVGVPVIQSSNKIAIAVVFPVHVSGFDSDVGEAHGVCVGVTDGQSARSAHRFSRPLIIWTLITYVTQWVMIVLILWEMGGMGERGMHRSDEPKCGPRR